MSKKLSDLTYISAIEAARAIQKGEVSSLELTKYILDRIEKYNPTLNAVVTILSDDALNRARAADEALAKGELWGPLHGVPCSVKDTFEIANVLTTAGVPALAKHIPKRNAVVVDRLLGAGAVIIGHTNVPFMASDLQSYNEIFGTSNNPWDHGRTPGGSTGGGAAALATGLSYLSIGSDIGGSIRTPSNFCGIFGHKPSLNVIPERGHIPPLPNILVPPANLSVIGPLARSAADLKLALNILGGPDPNDAIAYSWTLPPSRGTRLSDYRIGYILDDPLCPVISEVKELLFQVINALRNKGAELEEGWPPGVNPSSQYETYRFLLESTYAYQLQDDQEEEVREFASKKDGSDEMRAAWAWIAPHKHFQNASIARMTARKVWQDYFRTHDAFLLPTTFIPAFPHDHSEPLVKRLLDTLEGPRPYLDILFWISFATLTGLPATTAPIGLTKDGLPVGIQIIGPYLEDATPIDLAGILADITGGFQPPEGYKI
ncbi:MAG: amidase [Promethearchaeota archaeon]|jgi:amidase